MMKVLVKYYDGLILPSRANQSDAGYDVVATSDPVIVGDHLGGPIYRRVDYIEYLTGLFVAPLDFCYRDGGDVYKIGLDLRPRSSISKYDLSLANSVATIDSGYRGEIKVRFKYIFQPSDFVISDGAILGAAVNLSRIYKKGDKICQMLANIQHDLQFFTADTLDATDRGSGGFGSSGT